MHITVKKRVFFIILWSQGLVFLCFILITGQQKMCLWHKILVKLIAFYFFVLSWLLAIHTHTHTHTHCFCSALLLLSCVWNCFLVFLSFLFPSTESQEVLTSWSATAGSKTSKQGSLIKFWLSSVFDIQWRETWYLVQKSFAL